MKFSEFELHPDLRRGIEEAGYVDCMPVQEQVFPHAFKGEDIYAQSQTGTGKTAAFLVSIFQRIMSDEDSRHRKVLILAPTRELAAQIEAEAEKLGRHLSIKIASFFGGVSYTPQLDALRNGAQILVGTPGRIIDLVQQGKMMLGDVGFLVVDEADRMFDMGFVDDLRRLLRYLPSVERRQTYLFSATLSFRVKNLAWEYMKSPREIVIEAENVTVDMVSQELYHVGAHEKMRVLLGILEREKPESAIVFCNQKFMAEEVARRLEVNGRDCEFIMGDLPQSKRLQIIDSLKAGRLKLLVATDVAARGLDVEALDLVVNYDVPLEAESYVHRIGRTARAGKTGKAVTLACEKFIYSLPAVEKYIEMKIPVFPVTENLLLEDKSAVMRFGHARERSREAGHGEHRRPSDRGPRGLERGPRRDGRSAPAPRDRGPRDESRRIEAERSPRPRRGEGAPLPREREGARGPERAGNPYEASADERMRRYKEKYGAAAEGSSNAQAPRTEGKRPGSRQDPRRDARRPDARDDARRDADAREGGRGKNREGARGPKAPRDGARTGEGHGPGQRRSGGQENRSSGSAPQRQPKPRANPAPQAAKPKAPEAKVGGGLVGKLLGVLGLRKKP